MDLAELRFSNIVCIPLGFETIKFLLNNSRKTKLNDSFSSLSSGLYSPDSTISVKKLITKLLQLRLRHDHQASIRWLEWDDPYMCALSPANSSVCSLQK